MERGKAILGGNSEMRHGEVEISGMLKFLGRGINGVRIQFEVLQACVFLGNFDLLYN